MFFTPTDLLGHTELAEMFRHCVDGCQKSFFLNLIFGLSTFYSHKSICHVSFNTTVVPYSLQSFYLDLEYICTISFPTRFKVNPQFEFCSLSPLSLVFQWFPSEAGSSHVPGRIPPVHTIAAAKVAQARLEPGYIRSWASSLSVV